MIYFLALWHDGLFVLKVLLNTKQTRLVILGLGYQHYVAYAECHDVPWIYNCQQQCCRNLLRDFDENF